VGLLAVVDDTVMDDVVGTVVDAVVGAEVADGDPSVGLATTVLDVARCESEHPIATIARVVNPSHNERKPTRAECPIPALQSIIEAHAEHADTCVASESVRAVERGRRRAVLSGCGSLNSSRF